MVIAGWRGTLSLNSPSTPHQGQGVADPDTGFGSRGRGDSHIRLRIAADIKWPNDVMARGRKICGILVESATEGDQLQYAVLGIGVNVSQRSFPPDLSQPATSLFLELGSEITLQEVLRSLLARANDWYRAATIDAKLAISRWEELSSYARGCEVRITSPEGSVEGTTRGLTANGALVIELGDGQIREIVSGEVSLRAG